MVVITTVSLIALSCLRRSLAILQGEAELSCFVNHDDVIKWRHSPRYWPFVRGIHRSPVNSPHKGQWRGALMFPPICAWIHGCANNCEAGDSRRHRSHYDVTVMNNARKLWQVSYRTVVMQIWVKVSEWHTWWRHQMETFSALLSLWAGNSPGTGEFSSQRPVTRSF